jgi:hypothetical protein
MFYNVQMSVCVWSSIETNSTTVIITEDFSSSGRGMEGRKATASGEEKKVKWKIINFN